MAFRSSENEAMLNLVPFNFLTSSPIILPPSSNSGSSANVFLLEHTWYTTVTRPLPLPFPLPAYRKMHIQLSRLLQVFVQMHLLSEAFLIYVILNFNLQLLTLSTLCFIILSSTHQHLTSYIFYIVYVVIVSPSSEIQVHKLEDFCLLYS